MNRIKHILTILCLIFTCNVLASGPETCDSLSIGSGDFYFTQGGDSTLHINLTYIGSEVLAYPLIQVQMDDTTYFVVDGWEVQSQLETQSFQFTIRYKQPNVPANTTVGGKLRITNPNLNPPLDCAVRLDIHINSNTGVTQTIEAPFKVFPNPASETLVVQTTGNLQEKYRLINALGQPVRSGTCSGTTTIEVHDLPSGMYFLTHPSGWQHMVLVVPR